MAIIQTIKLRLTAYKVPCSVYAVQNDTGRQLRAVIEDVEIPAGTEADLTAQLPDGSTVDIACTLDTETNSFLCDLSDALTQKGTVKCWLRPQVTEGSVSSCPFNLIVLASEEE